jgi:hypothetical protein
LAAWLTLLENNKVILERFKNLTTAKGDWNEIEAKSE